MRKELFVGIFHWILISRALDADDSGQLELSEIVYFFKKFSTDKKISLKLIILLLAKRLELAGKSSEEYFRENKLFAEKRVDVFEFH